FARASADMILYRVTVDDPASFVRPWTIEVPLTLEDNKKNLIFESACYEGNYSLTSMLAGARKLEREAAARRRWASRSGVGNLAPAPGPEPEDKPLQCSPRARRQREDVDRRAARRSPVGSGNGHVLRAVDRIRNREPGAVCDQPRLEQELAGRHVVDEEV